MKHMKLITFLFTAMLAVTVFSTETKAAENSFVQKGQAELISTVDNIASGVIDEDYGQITWVIDSDGKLTVNGTGDFSDTSSAERVPWYSHSYDITSAEINVTGMTDASDLFLGCSNMHSVDLRNFDTSKITDMELMFAGCENLQYVDVSDFDTHNVTNMAGMFQLCFLIETLDVSEFDTSSVTNMKCMFYGCESVSELDVSGFNTSNVTDMTGMFGGCKKVSDLDLSSFDTSNVIDMHSMFWACETLETLDLSGFDTSNVTKMWSMFDSCKSMKELDLSSFNTNKVQDMSYMFYYCLKLENVDMSGFNTSKVQNMNGMFWACESLSSINVSGFDTSNVRNMGYMFYMCRTLQELDVSGFNTSDVKNMEYMFAFCDSLRSVEIGSLDISSVTWIDGLFCGCSSLQEVDLSGLNMSAAGNMLYMFSNCNSLERIKTPLNCLRLAKLPKTDEKCVWYQADGTESEILPIGLSYSITIEKNKIPDTGNSVGTNGFDIASGEVDKEYGQITWVIDRKGKLTVTGTGDVSKSKDDDRAPWNFYRNDFISAEINVSGMTDASFLFYECEALEGIEAKGLDMADVEDMSYMFYYCGSLKELNLTTWDVSKTMQMDEMFAGCMSLTKLDISNWNIKNVISAEDMLSGCWNLEEIRVPLNCNLEIELSTFEEDDKWYLPDGTVITTLPQGLVESITIMKNKIPEVTVPESYIASGVIDEDYGQITWMIDQNGKLTVSGTGDVRDKTGYQRIPWHEYVGSITSAEINVTGMTDASALFLWCTNLESVDLSGFDVSKVTNMESMFDSCSSLKELDLSGWDTRNVTNMYCMFIFCDSLEKINLEGWDTSSVTNMDGMFARCNSLKELDLSGFDTSSVTSMVSMFEECYELKTINLSSFDTSKVTNMEVMFRECDSLEKLDIKNFDMSLVERIEGMFDGCDQLQEIEVPVNCFGEIELPAASSGDKWYLPEGTVITTLPQGLTESITIMKNQIPETETPEVPSTPVIEVFKDVSAGSWYIDAVQYVYDHGIMSGSNGMFNPTKNVTRVQVVATLYNLEGQPKVTDYSAVKEFGDVKSGQWYTDAVCWAYSVGVANGNSTTKMFNTNNPVTRQQLATFFFNYAGYKGLDTKTRTDISDMMGADQVASYALDTMQWAVGTGIIGGSATTVNGVTVKDLKPTGTATRAQMASILQKFCEKNNI